MTKYPKAGAVAKAAAKKTAQASIPTAWAALFDGTCDAFRTPAP